MLTITKHVGNTINDARLHGNNRKQLKRTGKAEAQRFYKDGSSKQRSRFSGCHHRFNNN